MSQYPSNYSGGDYGGRPSGGGGAIFGKQILLLGLLVVGGILVYRTFFSGDSSPSFLGLGSSRKPVQLNYIPSDFQPSLDEESTLRILSDPEKYHKEFDELVYNFNLSLVYHVANRMGLPDSLKHRLEPEYKKHHEYLKSLYFNDFVALKDTTANMYETWYNDNSNQAVKVFDEVAGKYTCFFVTQIMATLLKANVLAKGRKVEDPCSIAINEGLRPMVDRLEKRAAIYDFSASHGFLKEKVRRSIVQLATYEYQNRLGIDKTLQYKIFGFSISETNIKVEAISVVKAGFDLNKYFDITLSPSKNTVYITLPQPEILSHEVYPRVDNLDVGFLAGINGEEMNRNLNELRREFRREAIEDEHVLDKARMRADSVMTMLMGPMVHSMGRKYRLEVRYKDSPAELDEAELRRRAQEATKKQNTQGDRQDPVPLRPLPQ